MLRKQWSVVAKIIAELQGIEGDEGAHHEIDVTINNGDLIIIIG